MKHLIIITIFLLFSTNSICLGQTKHINFQLEDNKKLNIVLNGRVETIKIKSEHLVNKSLNSIDYAFNKKGFPDKIIYYGLGFNAIIKKLEKVEDHYNFKENKLLSRLNKLSFGNDGEIYEYDKNYNLISTKIYMSDILIKEILSKYDHKNRIIEKTEYSYGAYSDYNPITQEGKSKHLKEVEKYEYNSQDKVILKSTYNYKGKETLRLTQNKYDENGNLIEEGECVSDGQANCDIKPLFGYMYNSQNLITKKYELAKFSPPYKTEVCYQYDEKGNVIEYKGLYIYPDKDPIIGFLYQYEYNEFGNIIKDEEIIGEYRSLGFDKYKTQITQYDTYQNVILIEYLTAEGSSIKVISKKYEYDRNGNWVKMETFEGKNKEDLKPTEISNREINYYK
ncbi:MAG: hypothetical protein IT220_01135 [Flavobacteriaceae bacterium]|nr:hypothetical protein [Flavobacteriaceae bacterium]